MALTQVAYRLRNDDGSETTATWRQNQNVVDTIAVDSNFRIRFEIQNATTAANNKVFQLQYNLNSAGFVNVSGTSIVVRASASPNLADAANLTNQLTLGTGTFVGATGFDEGNGQAGGTAMDLLATGHAEAEFCVQIRGVDVNHGDTIELRATDGGTAFPSYTSGQALITVTKVATGDFIRTEAPDTLSVLVSVLVEGTTALIEAFPLDTASMSGGAPRVIGKITQLNALLWPSRRYGAFRSVAAVTGDVAVTDTNDSATSTSNVAWQTSFALSEAIDVLAATGSVLIEGTSALTEVSDTFAAVSIIAYTGDLIATGPPDTASISATVTTIGRAVSKITQLNALLWPSRRYGNFVHVSVDITGNLAVTEAADTALFAGAAVGLGTIAASEAADAYASSGTLGTPVFLKHTQLNAALWPSRRYGSFVGRAQQAAGSLISTEAADAAAIQGTLPIPAFGTMAALDPQIAVPFLDESGNPILDESGNPLTFAACADVAAATGTLGAGLIGNIAVTEAADTVSSSATGSHVLTMAVSESAVPDSAAAIGSVSPGLAGQLSATEPSTDNANATGLVIVLGDLAASEAQDVAQIFSLATAAQGDMDADEDVDTFAGVSAQYLAVIENADTFASTGVSPLFAVLAATEPTDQASNAAIVQWLTNIALLEGKDFMMASAGAIIGNMNVTEGAGAGGGGEGGRLVWLTVVS